MSPALLSTLVLIGLVAIFVALFRARTISRTKRRSELMARPFPDAWKDALVIHFPLYAALPREKRDLLHQHMQVFLTEKSFEGCAGLEVTEQMRVVIAAQACLLLLNGKGDFYPGLRSILIYPEAYRSRRAALFSSHHHEGEESINAGESWSSGSVILSWHDVRHGARDKRDGYNVVIHEFAHQLDQASGDADGAPPLHHRSGYRTWSRVLGEAYQEFQGNLDRGRRTVFDEYGATAPEEFFAVATETFFEKPRQLREAYPDLYDEFKAYYELDPAAW